MIAEQYPGLLQLPDEKKLQLAGELWHDVIGDLSAEDSEPSHWIEDRLAEYQAHPERVSNWAEVKARLMKLRR